MGLRPCEEDQGEPCNHAKQSVANAYPQSGGAYASQASNWITCADPSATLSRRDLSLREDIRTFLESRAIKPLKCPLEWAKDANSYDCVRVC